MSEVDTRATDKEGSTQGRCFDEMSEMERDVNGVFVTFPVTARDFLQGLDSSLDFNAAMSSQVRGYGQCTIAPDVKSLS